MAVGGFRSRDKVPGPDGIPSLVWGVVHATQTGRLSDVYNLCLREGTFPSVRRPGRVSWTSPQTRLGIRSGPGALSRDLKRLTATSTSARVNSVMSTSSSPKSVGTSSPFPSYISYISISSFFSSSTTKRTYITQMIFHSLWCFSKP